MATSPNYGWLEPDNTDLVKNGALAIRTLGNAIDTTMATMTPKSTFTAKGSIAAATAASTPANLAVGNNGESLVADSSTSTGLRYNASANANLIAGGSFDIWQRGTGAFTANGVYTSDRFYTYSSSSYSLSQETSVIPDGATNAVKITSTAGSSFANMQFALEQSEVEKLAGQTVTFSVYLRANATYNGATKVAMYSNTTGNTQTGGTWTIVSGATTNHTPSTSAYTRVSVTGTIPTTAKGLAFYIGQTAVLANGSILYVALAKAELGSVATPFVRAGGTIQGELAACQRYYWRNTTAGSFITYGNAYATNGVAFVGKLPQTMRVTPTSLESATLEAADNVGANLSMSAVTLSASISSPDTFYISGTVTGSTQFRQYALRIGTSGYIGFSAEL